MDNAIEGQIIEDRKISHVTKMRFDVQALPLRDCSILLQLPGGIVDRGHVRAGRRQNRCLLAATACQAQNALAGNWI